MTGKETIIEKILSDARQIANSTLEEGGRRADEILAVANNDARLYREKNMAESYAEREEIIRRKITVGNLEVKKMLLQAKQELMQKSFDAALLSIKNDEKSYLSLLGNMLAQSEDGDTVYFSKEDKKIANESFLAAQNKKLNRSVKFGGYGEFMGGILLTGKDSDKNLTLESELKNVRDTYEPEIAVLLFEENDAQKDEKKTKPASTTGKKKQAKTQQRGKE